MNQSITVSQKTLEAIFDRLEKVTREVKSIRKSLKKPSLFTEVKHGGDGQKKKPMRISPKEK